MDIFWIKERKRKKVKLKISQTIECIFPVNLEDYQLWQKWVNERRRDKDSLVEFLSKEIIKDSLKAIALYLLLMPSKEWNLFYWKEEHELQGVPVQFYLTFWEKLSKELRDFAVYLICFFHDLKWDYKKEVMDIYNVSYNDCIISLMPFYLVTCKQGNKLLPCFDIDEYFVSDREMGDFATMIFSNQKLDINLEDISWKEMIDAMIQRRLKDLFRKNEYASRGYFYKYKESIFHNMKKRNDFFHRKLLIQQIDFLMSFGGEFNRKLIEAWDLELIFDLFSEERYKEFLKRFFVFYFFKEKWSLGVYGSYEDKYKKAKKMYEKCKSLDLGEKIINYLESKVSNYKKYLEDQKTKSSIEEKEITQKKYKDEMIYGQMKK